MSQTYFISDTHFGHANLVRLARTEFSDIVRHDMTIRQNWRDTVGKDDEVWMLGDFAYRCGYALEPLPGTFPGTSILSWATTTSRGSNRTRRPWNNSNPFSRWRKST